MLSVIEACQRYAGAMWTKELERCQRTNPELLEKMERDQPEQIENFRAGLLEQAVELSHDLRRPDSLFEAVNRGRLHPGNKVSRQLFVDLTGNYLPPTVSGTLAAIRDHVGATAWDLMVSEREQAEREDREQQEQAEREEREAADAERMESLAESIRENQQIDGDDLLFAARQLGIKVHPRTAGTLKKRVYGINRTSARCSGSHLPNSVYYLYRDCADLLTELAAN